MAEELRPCPFCGGDAKEFTGEDAAPHRWTVECDSCGAHVGSDTRYKARAKWNRRAERTCRMEQVHEYQDEWESFGIRCSLCGEFVPGWISRSLLATGGKPDMPWPNYCPHCGAKVVSK